mgnify:FL=1|tara:strand:+ start:148 stop:342 length:195 start_codon:yes stop_codon:yes gene_type:complete
MRKEGKLFILGSIIAGFALYMGFAAMCRFFDSLIQGEVALASVEIAVMIACFFVIAKVDQNMLS